MKTKTILIPSDFSVRSLNAVKHALDKENGMSLNVILFHCMTLSDSITEMLFFSKKKILNSIINEDFADACNILKNRHSDKINSIRTDLFTGQTSASFINYIEGNGVDQIYVPKGYEFNKIHENSFNPAKFIEKTTLPLTEVNLSSERSESKGVGQLFYT